MHTLTFNMRHAASTSKVFFRLARKLSRGINRAGQKEFEQGFIVTSPYRSFCVLSSRVFHEDGEKFLTSSHRARQIRIFHHEQSKEISETTILLQQGSGFQELPIAVLKSDAAAEPKDKSTEPTRSYIDLDPAEELAFIEGFNSYNSPQEVLRILDTIPSREVTPLVSFSILKRLYELERNFGFRNDGRSWIVSVDNGKKETFVRGAVIRELINKIIYSNNSNLLLDTLDILRSEKNQNYYLESVEFENYRSKLCDEIFVRVIQGRFSLKAACRAVCIFGEMEKDSKFKIDKKFIDKMWVIVEEGQEVTVNNIVDVFKTIQYFTKSQRLVFNILERKLFQLWWRIDMDAVSQICDIIGTKRQNEGWSWCNSGRMLMTLSRCTALNLHQVQENQLERIIKCFYRQDFCDTSIEMALGKYMKAKSSKINNPALLATIMDYAKKFGLRSLNILEGCLDYVILHSGANLSPPQITSIITCFGHLHFQPSNGVTFWNIFEKLLEDKFVQFPPKEILDIFLSCLYLGKYPLNFVSRIFSPYFLDRLNSSESDYSELQNVRSRLKLLDSSLYLECGWKYGASPLLPKDFSMRKLTIDGRVLRGINLIHDRIQDICNQHCSVEKSVYIPSMPLNELYIMDIVVIPIQGTESQLHNYIQNRVSLARENLRLTDNELDIMCILIHIPEHYSTDGEFIGPQVMRIRQLKALGFKVANIKYDAINEVKSQPKGLEILLRTTLASLQCPGVEI